MTVVDANMLLYDLNRSSEHHRAAKEWFDRALSRGETLGLPWLVLSALIRISTRRGVLPNPLSPEKAFRVVAQWLERPQVRVLTETEDHFEHMRRLADGDRRRRQSHHRRPYRGVGALLRRGARLLRPRLRPLPRPPLGESGVAPLTRSPGRERRGGSGQSSAASTAGSSRWMFGMRSKWRSFERIVPIPASSMTAA